VDKRTIKGFICKVGIVESFTIRKSNVVLRYYKDILHMCGLKSSFQHSMFYLVRIKELIQDTRKTKPCLNHSCVNSHIIG